MKIIVENFNTYSENKKVNFIRSVVEKNLDMTSKFNRGLGYVFENPVNIGVIDGYDMFVHIITLGYNDERDELIFDICWNKHNDNDSDIFKWKYDTYFISMGDIDRGITMEKHKFEVEPNFLDILISEIKKGNSVSEKANKLYHENNKIKQNTKNNFTLDELKVIREYDYYFSKYFTMEDSSYYLKKYNEIKDMVEGSEEHKEWVEKNDRVGKLANDIINQILSKNK